MGMKALANPRIQPGVDLDQIVIKLQRGRAPELEITGRLRTGDRHLDQMGSATIRTMSADAETLQFLAHLQSKLGGQK